MHDERLSELHHLDPQWSAGGSDRLQNHTTMVAHALHALGHDVGRPALDRYRPLRPPTGVTPTLGDGRFADWLAHWESQLAERSWSAVVAKALPLLAPGVLAGSLHGLLRVGHAVRALQERVSPARTRELAFGLAVWSSWYQTLDAPLAGAPVSLHELMAAIPPPPAEPTPGRLIDERIARAATRYDVRRWAGTINVGDDPERLATTLVDEAARAILHATPRSWGALVHGLTATSLVRVLAPLCDDWRTLAQHVVHAFGALLAAHPRAPHPASLDMPSRKALWTWAGRSEDHHVIKVIEAALREHASAPVGNGQLLVAAAHVAIMREPESEHVLFTPQPST